MYAVELVLGVFWCGSPPLAFPAAGTNDADYLSAVADVLQAVLAVLVAVVGGLWALNKWLAERRDARETAAVAERERLDQQRFEAEQKRQDRAAELVRALGASTDETSRLWAASALSIYPRETIPILVNALGHAEPSTAAAINIALASIGASAFEHLGRMNRAAAVTLRLRESAEQDVDQSVVQSVREADLLGAERLFSCTSLAIAGLLIQASEHERSNVDLDSVELVRINFSGTRLSHANFRKAILRGCIFSRTDLRGSSFRGTDVVDAVFTNAQLRRADFTGAQGPAGWIRADLRDAVLDYAHLAHSGFDGANLAGAILNHVDLSDASLRGSRLDRCRLQDCDLRRVRAAGVRAIQAIFVEARLMAADLAKARLSQARLERCRMMGVDLTSAQLSAARFIGCNLSGANLSPTVATDAVFDGCSVYGVEVNTPLSGATFTSPKGSESDLERLEVAGALVNRETQPRAVPTD